MKVLILDATASRFVPSTGSMPIFSSGLYPLRGSAVKVFARKPCFFVRSANFTVRVCKKGRQSSEKCRQTFTSRLKRDKMIGMLIYRIEAQKQSPLRVK
ncbi:MAG: hypothetical protein LBD02_03300 [Christensenellaceae bacterium]|nr:hypothetical protein [Christensenellaceae bacterium]